MLYQTLDVLNNKFPCEGPKAVPVSLDFSTAPAFDVDLKLLMLQNKISNVQSLFIDNASNTAQLVLTMSVQNQRIIIPPGAQAYITVLLNQAEFTVSTTSTALVNIFAQNFPVTNAVWQAPATGTATSNVAVSNFPANQLVTLATSGVSYAFNPSGTGVNLTTGAASANVNITSAAGQNIRILNTGANAVAVRWGTGGQTAVATDLTLAPNQAILVNSNGANNIAGISPGGASSLNIVVGSGGLTA